MMSPNLDLVNSLKSYFLQYMGCVFSAMHFSYGDSENVYFYHIISKNFTIPWYSRNPL